MSRRPVGFYGGGAFGANWGGGGSGGGGTPGGSDTQVQFNDGSVLGGDAGFTYNETSDFASLAGGLLLGNGSAAAPSLTFTNSATTGFYRAGADIIGIATAGVGRWTVNASGHWLAVTDNGSAIGQPGANRPSTGYFATSLIVGSNLLQISTNDFRAPAAGAFYWNTRSILYSPADGVILLTDNAATAFGSLLLGPSGTTYNRLKHGGTGLLQVRLADDSAFAAIQGNLRTQANAVAETPTATHTMIITDAGGTAYRVLCVV